MMTLIELGVLEIGQSYKHPKFGNMKLVKTYMSGGSVIYKFRHRFKVVRCSTNRLIDEFDMRSLILHGLAPFMIGDELYRYYPNSGIDSRRSVSDAPIGLDYNMIMIDGPIYSTNLYFKITYTTAHPNHKLLTLHELCRDVRLIPEPISEFLDEGSTYFDSHHGCDVKYVFKYTGSDDSLYMFNDGDNGGDYYLTSTEVNERIH